MMHGGRVCARSAEIDSGLTHASGCFTSRNIKPAFRHWSAGFLLGGGFVLETCDFRDAESNLSADMQRLQFASLAPAPQGHACNLPAGGKLCG